MLLKIVTITKVNGIIVFRWDLICLKKIEKRNPESDFYNLLPGYKNQDKSEFLWQVQSHNPTPHTSSQISVDANIAELQTEELLKLLMLIEE